MPERDTAPRVQAGRTVGRLAPARPAALKWGPSSPRNRGRMDRAYLDLTLAGVLMSAAGVALFVCLPSCPTLLLSVAGPLHLALTVGTRPAHRTAPYPTSFAAG